jgi:hypothetical protein
MSLDQEPRFPLELFSRLVEKRVLVPPLPSQASSSYLVRIDRMRSAGCARGEAEAKLFKLAVGNDFNRWQAISWINDAIEDGLSDWP